MTGESHDLISGNILQRSTHGRNPSRDLIGGLLLNVKSVVFDFNFEFSFR